MNDTPSARRSLQEGLAHYEMCVFARSESELPSGEAASERGQRQCGKVLDVDALGGISTDGTDDIFFPPHS